MIALAGGEPSRAIMVGDSDVDIATAKGASVPSILVSFGYAPPGLDQLAPDAVIDHFDALVPSATPPPRQVRDWAARWLAAPNPRQRFALIRPECSQRGATVESHLHPPLGHFAYSFSKGERRC